MPIPGSLYYVQYKEDEKGLYEDSFLIRCEVFLSIVQDGQALFKRTYAVSNDRTIMVSPLQPGKTYITILVAGDGILAETRSDPQKVTALGKGKFRPMNDRLFRMIAF